MVPATASRYFEGAGLVLFRSDIRCTRGTVRWTDLSDAAVRGTAPRSTSYCHKLRRGHSPSLSCPNATDDVADLASTTPWKHIGSTVEAYCRVAKAPMPPRALPLSRKNGPQSFGKPHRRACRTIFRGGRNVLFLIRMRLKGGSPYAPHEAKVSQWATLKDL